MAEIHVSATDFRVHLKDLANHVATSGDAVVMERHGQRMAVMVSWEDYQLLLKHKPCRAEKAVASFLHTHPEDMALDQVVRIYADTAKSKDPRIMDWRGKAAIIIWARTGKIPPWNAPS